MEKGIRKTEVPILIHQMENISTINAASCKEYVLRDNDGRLMFIKVEEHDDHIDIVEGVRVISVEVEVDSISRRSELSANALDGILSALTSANILEKQELWFFVTDGPWQEDNRITRRQRMWNRTGYRQRHFHETNQKYDYEVESNEGVRYAGCINFTEVTSSDIIEEAYNLEANFFVALSMNDFHGSQTVRNVFHAAYPNLESRIVWPHLLTLVSEMDCLMLRIDRESHDLKIYFDIFFSLNV